MTKLECTKQILYLDRIKKQTTSWRRLDNVNEPNHNYIGKHDSHKASKNIIMFNYLIFKTISGSVE